MNLGECYLAYSHCPTTITLMAQGTAMCDMSVDASVSFCFFLFLVLLSFFTKETIYALYEEAVDLCAISMWLSFSY